MKWLFCAALCGVAMAGHAATPLARHEKLELRKVVPNQSSISRYDLFELKLDFGAIYENPFDSEQIDVHAVFKSPKGRSVQVNGFLDQTFTRKLENDVEKIQPAGEPGWKLRFVPDEAGSWRCDVFIKDTSGMVQLPTPLCVEVTESTAPGFIGRSKVNSSGFSFENGTPFFGVGENMCWGGKRGSFDYDQWLPELSGAGGNFIRIWMSSWNCAMEWSQSNRGEWRNGDYHGVGIYSLDNAWKLDAILDLAQTNGVYVMLCLGTYGEFNEGGYFNEGQWKANPYNMVNGGPCAKAEEFWTQPTARKLYQRRLRYLTARYGHRLNLHSWEFWNEAKAPVIWVSEMARFMKGTGEFQGQPADPYRHLVSTTYGDSQVWQTPEIDFTQTHSYGTGNIPDHAITVLRETQTAARFNKPHLMAEFGIDWRSPDSKYDSDNKGVNFHNALWASVVSGDGGSAMTWWWDNYIHPQKLFRMYTPLRKFIDQVPWGNGAWKPLQISAPDEVQAAGLSSGRHAILWIHNRAHHWKNIYEKREIPIVSTAEITLANLPAGSYQAEWWDTWSGKVLRQEARSASSAGAKLTVTELTTDIALRLSPQ